MDTQCEPHVSYYLFVFLVKVWLTNCVSMHDLIANQR